VSQDGTEVTRLPGLHGVLALGEEGEPTVREGVVVEGGVEVLGAQEMYMWDAPQKSPN
jgi:hypothetical protein